MHPAHVLYVLAPFRIMFKLPGGRSAVREAKAGDVLFSEAVMHSPTNIGDSDAHGILVELKGQTALPAAADGRAALGNVLTAVTFIEGRPGAGVDARRVRRHRVRSVSVGGPAGPIHADRGLA